MYLNNIIIHAILESQSSERRIFLPMNSIYGDNGMQTFRRDTKF